MPSRLLNGLGDRESPTGAVDDADGDRPSTSQASFTKLQQDSQTLKLPSETSRLCLNGTTAAQPDSAQCVDAASVGGRPNNPNVASTQMSDHNGNDDGVLDEALVSHFPHMHLLRKMLRCTSFLMPGSQKSTYVSLMIKEFTDGCRDEADDATGDHAKRLVEGTLLGAQSLRRLCVSLCSRHLQQLSDLMGVYVTCELRIANTFGESKSVISERIIRNLESILDCPSNEMPILDSILHTFVAVPKFYKQREIVTHVLKHFLRRGAGYEEIKDDHKYIQYIVVFSAWKSLYPEKFDVQLEIVRLATNLIQPSTSLKTNPTYAALLPPYEWGDTATKEILNNLRHFKDMRDISLYENSFLKKVSGVLDPEACRIFKDFLYKHATQSTTTTTITIEDETNSEASESNMPMVALPPVVANIDLTQCADDDDDDDVVIVVDDEPDDSRWLLHYRRYALRYIIENRSLLQSSNDTMRPVDDSVSLLSNDDDDEEFDDDSNLSAASNFTNGYFIGNANRLNRHFVDSNLRTYASLGNSGNVVRPTERPHQQKKQHINNISKMPALETTTTTTHTIPLGSEHPSSTPTTAPQEQADDAPMTTTEASSDCGKKKVRFSDCHLGPTNTTSKQKRLPIKPIINVATTSQPVTNTLPSTLTPVSPVRSLVSEISSLFNNYGQVKHLTISSIVAGGDVHSRKSGVNTQTTTTQLLSTSPLPPRPPSHESLPEILGSTATTTGTTTILTAVASTQRYRREHNNSAQRLQHPEHVSPLVVTTTTTGDSGNVVSTMERAQQPQTTPTTAPQDAPMTTTEASSDYGKKKVRFSDSHLGPTNTTSKQKRLPIKSIINIATTSQPVSNTLPSTLTPVSPVRINEISSLFKHYGQTKHLTMSSVATGGDVNSRKPSSSTQTTTQLPSRSSPLEPIERTATAKRKVDLPHPLTSLFGGYRIPSPPTLTTVCSSNRGKQSIDATTNTSLAKSRAWLRKLTKDTWYINKQLEKQLKKIALIRSHKEQLQLQQQQETATQVPSPAKRRCTRPNSLRPPTHRPPISIKTLRKPIRSATPTTRVVSAVIQDAKDKKLLEKFGIIDAKVVLERVDPDMFAQKQQREEQQPALNETTAVVVHQEVENRKDKPQPQQLSEANPPANHLMDIDSCDSCSSNEVPVRSQIVVEAEINNVEQGMATVPLLAVTPPVALSETLPDDCTNPNANVIKPSIIMVKNHYNKMNNNNNNNDTITKNNNSSGSGSSTKTTNFKYPRHRHHIQ